ncbi:Nin one binding Zn-ribbon like-domain-containing protein [Obelidium mucronatum]|nr:Nin one binding Zn-ribbon like-domain-containing protein [Obelidium mucronatum]
MSASNVDSAVDDDGFQAVVGKGKKGRSTAGRKPQADETPSTLTSTVQKHQKHTATLVADTAAFIRGVRLDLLADEVVTVDEVLLEVRDQAARANLALAVALAGVKTRRPSDESIAAVAAFARKTGDFGVLSRTDVKVLALAWMLEVEKNGRANVRAEPVRPTPFVARKKNQQQQQQSKEDKNLPMQVDAAPISIDSTQSESMDKDDTPPTEHIQESSRIDEDANIVYEDEEDDEDRDVKLADSADSTATVEVSASNTTASKSDDAQDEELDLFNDGGEDDGWITPGNIAKIKAQHEQKIQTQLAAQGKVSVGCITSDFAMQNVLLQMNLKLISVDGVVIKKAKSWIMRCHGCYKTTTDMTKIFCPSCGNNTLMRTSCSVDGNGRMTYYLKRNYQYNLRGTKYSIPTPKGGHAGKTGGDMILREDQKEFQAAVRSQRIAQKKADYLDVDYVHFAETNSRGGGGFGGPVVGHGKKNPNSGKGRRRK